MKKEFAMLLTAVLILSIQAGCGQKKLQDGSYTVEAALSGGSGRATITTPAELEIRDGSMMATIVWSSPYYEYMIVDDVRYEPVQEEGNAAFIIPVVLDQEMVVSASTIAMSQPHLIDYSLYFDSATIEESGT